MIIGLRVPPKWLATCLVHWKGVFIAWAQAEREVVKPPRSTDLVNVLEVVLPLLGEPIEEQVLVHAPFQAPLRAGAIVADDVQEDGVLGVG